MSTTTGGEGSRRKRQTSLNENLEEKSTSDPISGSSGTQPATTVEDTPKANGTIPSNDRVNSQNDAQSQLASDKIAAVSDSPTGRSNTTDMTFTLDEVDKAWADPDMSFTLDEVDQAWADPANTTSLEEVVVPYRANAPHYFEEAVEQDFYHEMIVYIQGVDVSPWLQGSIRFNNRTGINPNQCTFTLNNAANRFTITTENLRGIFRLSPGADYDETCKYDLFNFKADEGNNPVDPISGGRRWPLNHNGLIFHKYDPVRVWVRNPVAPVGTGPVEIGDEWMPKFTGYIISKTKSENCINAESEITIICEDIRHLMRYMNVNTNTANYILPGELLSGNISSDYLIKQYPGPVNKQLDKSYFRNLTVRSMYDNPWVDLTLRELVKALTFSENAQDVISGAKNSRKRDSYLQRAAQLEEQIAQAKATGDTTSLTDLEQNYKTVKQQLEALDNAGASIANAKAGESSGTNYTPGTEPSNKIVTMTSADLAKGGMQSRLGSMQRGIFPMQSGQKESTIPAGNSKDEVENRKIFLQNWHSIVTFGQPIRENVKTTFSDPSGATTTTDNYGARNGLLTFPGPCRYWTESEVRSAGRLTRTDRAWRPDAQAVHMLEPGASTAGAAMFQDLKIIDGSNVAATRSWSNRLEIIAQACSIIDYRFYISGTGDLILEPPMYDFSPKDFGAWEKIFTFNYHVNQETLDEERNDVKTVVVATGRIVGLQNVNQPQSLTDFGAIPYDIVWSPTLVSRFGMQVEVINFPRITDKKRLQQLAALHFQKQIGLIDTYDMSTVYRPWTMLNRPIYNAYKSRFALVDEEAVTLPVTHGQGEPNTQLSMNYTRPLDEAGIPRFITGGASQAVFFGELSNNASITEAIAARANALKEAITRLQRDRSVLTNYELQKIRETFDGFLPMGQDSYNVLRMVTTEAAALSEDGSTIEQTLSELDENLAAYDALRSNGKTIDQASPKELQAISDSNDVILNNLKSQNINAKSKNGDANYGKSGVYSIDMDTDSAGDDKAPEPTAQPVKPERDAQGYVLEWGNVSQGNITYNVTRDDRATIISYLTWQGAPEDLVLWTLLQAFVYQYPTEQSLGVFIQKNSRTTNPVPNSPGAPTGTDCRGCFGYVRQRNPDGTPKHTHQGVDIAQTADLPVVAALSGKVEQASEVWEAGFSGYGKHVVIKCDKHDSLWTLYAHLNSVLVKPGVPVYKGQQIGTTGATAFYSKRTVNGVTETVPINERTDNTRSNLPHLHWETAISPYPQPSSEVNRINPVNFLDPIIDENTAPDIIISTVNGVLDGSIASKNKKAVLYKSGVSIEGKMSRATGKKLTGQAAAQAYSDYYKDVGNPITIEEGFGYNVNWFFENPEGIEIPIKSYRKVE